MIPPQILTALAILISAVWLVNVVLGFLAPERHDPAINGLFAVVVGALFAVGRKDNRAG